MSDVLSDIAHLKNIIIGNINNSNLKILKKPVIKIETLHSCYSHAVVDCAFPTFWVIEDIKKKYPKFNDFIILISNKLIFQYPQNLNFINKNKKEYKGSFNDLIKILTPETVLFEHLLDESFLVEDMFVYPEQDFWQRTPWNCNENYPGRHVGHIRFDDNTIYSKLNSFRNKVLEYSQVNIKKSLINNLIIIDRKYNRKFESNTLNELIRLSKQEKNWKFQGIFTTEDLSFKEQVNLFSSNNIFISRHGSTLTNLLWCPPSSTVFDIEGGPDGVSNSGPVFNRILKLTNSKHYYLKYNFDIEKEIFSKL